MRHHVIKLPHVRVIEFTAPLLDVTRFSKLSTALRTVARVDYFLHRVASRVNEKRHTPIQIAEKLRLSIATAETFVHADVNKIIDESELSREFRNMLITRDKDGIIRHMLRLSCGKHVSRGILEQPHSFYIETRRPPHNPLHKKSNLHIIRMQASPAGLENYSRAFKSS
ncbi:hypothetical protein COOONC_23286 [Cooperia oncophora]